MANSNVTVNSRYLTYNKDDVQTLLDRVAAMETATGDEVRALRR